MVTISQCDATISQSSQLTATESSTLHLCQTTGYCRRLILKLGHFPVLTWRRYFHFQIPLPPTLLSLNWPLGIDTVVPLRLGWSCLNEFPLFCPVGGVTYLQRVVITMCNRQIPKRQNLLAYYCGTSSIYSDDLHIGLHLNTLGLWHKILFMLRIFTAECSQYGIIYCRPILGCIYVKLIQSRCSMALHDTLNVREKCLQSTVFTKSETIIPVSFYLVAYKMFSLSTVNKIMPTFLSALKLIHPSITTMQVDWKSPRKHKAVIFSS